jgi:hypothetical protein
MAHGGGVPAIPSRLSLGIAATHPGFPAGALRAAWTGPGRDAGEISKMREWQASG